MATKPIDLPVWATDTNYTNGDYVGQPTKVEPPSGKQDEGWVPKDKPAAEYQNWLQNLTYQWCVWVEGGKSNFDADKHIVETDSTGTAKVRQLSAQNNNSNPAVNAASTHTEGNAFQASVTAAATSGYVGYFGCNDGSPQYCLYLDGQESPNTLTVLNVDGTLANNSNLINLNFNNITSKGIKITLPNLAASTCYGVEINAKNDGVGIDVTADDDSHGIRIENTDGTGLEITKTGAANTGNALKIANQSAAPTVYIESGTASTASAISVLSVDDAVLSVVKIETINTADDGTEALRLTARGDAEALVADSSAGQGYAIIATADPTNPQHAAILLSPQDNNPSAPEPGAIFYHENDKTLKYCTSNTPNTLCVWGTKGGSVFNSITNNAPPALVADTNTDVLTLELNGDIAPRYSGGKLVFNLSFNTATGSGQKYVVELYDQTAGTVIGPVRFFENISAAQPTSCTCHWVYSVPVAGDREFRIRVTAVGTASTVDDILLTVIGAFD